jgi:hypothetical protein
VVRSGLLRARLRRRTACGKSARAGQVGSERADGDRAGPMRAHRGLLVRARRWARWLSTCCARRAARRRARRRVRVSGCDRGHAAHHWRAPSRACRGGGISGSSGGWRARPSMPNFSGPRLCPTLTADISQLRRSRSPIGGATRSNQGGAFFVVELSRRLHSFSHPPKTH